MVTVEERWDSRDRTEGVGAEKSSTELLWVINGTTLDDVALTNLSSSTPTSYSGLPLLNISVDRIAWETWLGTANYGDGNVGSTPEVGSPVFTFDTTGGTDHIKQSLNTTSYPGGAPDSKGAIGDNGETVEGVDIPTPRYAFSETHLIPAATVTPAYKAILFALTGRTNDAIFKGFEISEVLFLGATGSLRNDDYWEMTYSFVAIPNVTGIQIGDITIDKKGHQYVDPKYEKKEDGGKMVNQPFAVDVHDVFPEGNMALLGLGI